MEVSLLAKGSHDRAPQLKATETCCLTASESSSLESRSLQRQAPSRALWEDSPTLLQLPTAPVPAPIWAA